MSKADFGMIGLGTMGRNFLLNLADSGFSCVGFDLDPKKGELLLAEAGRTVSPAPNTGDAPGVIAAGSLPEFAAALDLARKIMLLVPAGTAVDAVIEDLLPLLQSGDLIVDAGNSHFSDTKRRERYLGKWNIRFLGAGISGGEEGARRGASIMAGGDPEVYEFVRPMFEAASAKVNGEPCAARVGSGSAGHFVKMVHNGIEYGLMQLIAEAYDLLKRGCGKQTHQIAEIFDEWNRGELNSFLIEITAIILRKRDESSGAPLAEMILDIAGQKGTGKWASQAAMDLGVPIPTIDSAVTMRQLSARKAERVDAAKKLGVGPGPEATAAGPRDPAETLGDALHCAFIAAYAQGFAMLGAASKENGYDLDIAGIAKIWRGGCIIRAAMLEDFRTAIAGEPGLENIITSKTLSPVIRQKLPALRALVQFAVASGIPCMAAAATLNYIMAYASERLPANLIQAQRDLFGAHTYQRIDETGTFHTDDW
jgi:6-phosphogluconate dehydrogenase